MGKPWTEVERDLLEDLRKGGASVADIAKALGRSKGAITDALGRYGLAQQRTVNDWNDEAIATLKRLVAERLSGSQIGREMGVSKSAVVSRLAMLRRAQPQEADAWTLKPPMDSIWTAERVQRLRDMHAEGKSGAEIAKALGCGITRLAVAGKLHRLKLNRRENFRSHHPTPSALKTYALPTKRVDDTAKPGVALVDLRFCSCRWPIRGEGADTLFCGDEKVDGSSYCATHRRRSMPPPRSPAHVAADEVRRQKTILRLRTQYGPIGVGMVAAQ